MLKIETSITLGSVYAEIIHQKEASKFSNVARSFTKLKSAMNFWFKERLTLQDPPLYANISQLESLK